ncbi:ferritin-like domain-containing protein [Dongia sedimenti]|uniref:Ferritin-like domain-containing protein n=1 Tax=Dongia sedimenti TaxID=3064282 RepID=A0ABU0YJJ4_9PROT|nr:ferritin-like domain-containing protein [Rhodospirillaceae bacterium R-7]
MTLLGSAVEVLSTADPAAKATASHRAAAAWRAGDLAIGAAPPPPDRPARPERPLLLAPKEMPKRKAGGNAAKRTALLHALAHIELNAIDLAWDLIARFGTERMPRPFFDDWVMVADEEALHFELLSARLQELGAAYGDLPAHDGLWEAAITTSQDLLARLAIVPLVLEARGLDVTPATVADMQRAGDDASAALLDRIYRDEIGHVAAGMRWFEHFARGAGEDPQLHWQALLRRYFRGVLKPPFNDTARAAAGMPSTFYRQ